MSYETSAYAAYNKAKAESNAACDAVGVAIATHNVAADHTCLLLQAARAETKAVVNAIAAAKHAADTAEVAAASTISDAKFTIESVIEGTYDAAHISYKAAYKKSMDVSEACVVACRAFRTVYEAAKGHAIPYNATPRANAKAQRKAASARLAINISTEAAAKVAKAADSPVAIGALEAAARTLDAVSNAVSDAIYAREAANAACDLARKAGV